ncbi:nitrilase-related carbon-nitrogen hydrolase [Pseudoramibacter alactolyticus]
MKAYGMVRTALAIPEIRVADPAANTAAMMVLGEEAAAAGVGILLFPELAVTGYTCGDLFAQSALLAGAEAGLAALAEWSQAAKMLVVVGAPIPVGSALYNCGVAINRGRILGAVPKTYIPNTHEFYEKRWFAASRQLQEDRVTHAGQTFPIGTDLLFSDRDDANVTVGLEICEDLWAPAPPSGELAAAGATLVLNPSASNELTGKSEYRKGLVVQQSARCNAAYLYVSCGIGESTTDLVFGGEGLIVEKGTVLAQTERFAREDRLIFADVDVEALVHDRRTQSSFADAEAAGSYRRVAFSCQAAED